MKKIFFVLILLFIFSGTTYASGMSAIYEHSDVDQSTDISYESVDNYTDIEQRDISLKIPLSPGWNLVSPMVNYNNCTAQMICEEIAEQGGDVQEIDYFQNGEWKGHRCGLPFNNFPLSSGRGYFIKSSLNSNWTQAGPAIPSPLIIILNPGWNLISLPQWADRVFDARSLLSEINRQGGNCQEIDQFIDGDWRGHIDGCPFNNFPIVAGKGYALKCNSSVRDFTFVLDENRAASGITIRIQNLTDKTLFNHPILISQIFKKGDFPSGAVLRQESTILPTQLEVKRRYTDGSIKHALLISHIPEITSGSKMVVTISPSDSGNQDFSHHTPNEILALFPDFDCQLTFNVLNRNTVTISARDLLQSTINSLYWIRGNQVTEFILAGVPHTVDGAPEVNLRVEFHLRFFHGTNSVRIGINVENCWAGHYSNVNYDLTIRVGATNPKVVFTKAHSQLGYYNNEDGEVSTGHYWGSRWHRVFWHGPDLESAVHIKHDPVYLISTKCLPRYDLSLMSYYTDEFMDGLYQNWLNNTNRDILQIYTLNAYMPSCGGRPEIAPLHIDQVRYILSDFDPRLKPSAFSLGDAIASFPVHIRDRETDQIYILDNCKEGWFRGWNPNDGAFPYPLPQCPYTPDNAHQPSVAFLPYILSGDYFYCQELYFWGNFSVISQWPEPREQGRGLVIGDEIRGIAWLMRTLAQAAQFGPEEEAMVLYLDHIVQENLGWFNDFITNRINVGRYIFNPLGWIDQGPEPDQGGFVYNEQGEPQVLRIVSPWMEDFLIWAMDYLVDCGYPQAVQIRNWLIRWPIGRFTQDSSIFAPTDGCMYRMGVVRLDGSLINDWAELYKINTQYDAAGQLYVPFTSFTEDREPYWGGEPISYPWSCKMALAGGINACIDEEWNDRAQDAYIFLDSQLQASEEQRKAAAENPYFVIVPRNTQNTYLAN